MTAGLAAIGCILVWCGIDIAALTAWWHPAAILAVSPALPLAALANFGRQTR